MPHPKKTSPNLQSELVKKVFEYLAAIYGHLWTSQHVDANLWRKKQEVWAYALSELPESVITQTLCECAKNIKHVPTLPEFRELALKIQNRQQTQESEKQQKKEIELRNQQKASPEVPLRELKKLTHLPWIRKIIERREKELTCYDTFKDT